MLESVMARHMVDHVPGIELRFPPSFIYKGIEQELRLPSYLALLARETFYSLILTACRGFIQDLLRNHCRDEGSEGGSKGVRERGSEGASERERSFGREAVCLSLIYILVSEAH